ncbi:sodium:solute symporter family protein [Fulvivirga sedimenti]|uniref:Sodium:solute symporter family protein n=1 Tax=Fulvivirga sedimenti TaxID=2879465 RepID=A0A9X1HUU8_9BACT|nr:sodium:solute symporter family protein [Fulvivirga sedimenti]MCA6078729.1 sodium:solute symporter family protein [Fulvivirga sedimenti]
MHWIDVTIFVTYMLVMLGVGFFFLRKNKNSEDYYVGGRGMGAMHVGLSVVATDVGGGFSIGLGGLGFTMGISGSWMLFTGLLGAWLAAVLLIPTVSKLATAKKFLTFPQLFGHYYSKRVALLAGVISAIGYVGFTSSQILAGAKLASATFIALDMKTALLVMGVIAIVYTVMGGIKAVIYTDTIQWLILMGGLIFIGLPMGYSAIGGYDGIVSSVGPELLSLQNIEWQTLVNWSVTIIPIWFVGMTLYQRIYACGDEKVAKKAWFIAGLFEWPIMAFMGVLLGLFARVAAEQGMFQALGFSDPSAMDAEIGLPLLLRTILPVGLMGLMMSAYFSAIMSTADSCLMAASGNLQTDVFGKWLHSGKADRQVLRNSQWLTLLVGVLALILAAFMENVLNLMLYSYAFMVSGLFIPVIGALFMKRPSSLAAFMAMLTGGSITLVLILSGMSLPFGLDANIFGISAALAIFIIISIFNKRQAMEPVN